MPQHKSAIKRMRQNENRRQRNKSRKSRVRTKMKKLRAMTDAADAADAQSLLDDVKSELDRLAAKNIIHKNKAANYKSKLERHVNSLSEE
jgi:small subunit ribosomal protein S20